MLEFLALLDQLGVIVVDHASPDGTGALTGGFARDIPDRLIPIHRAAKMGFGTAYLAGFQSASERGADCLLTMDANSSHHPSTSVPCSLGSRKPA